MTCYNRDVVFTVRYDLVEMDEVYDICNKQWGVPKRHTQFLYNNIYSLMMHDCKYR